MGKRDLKADLLNAAAKGSLLTPKHAPASVGSCYPFYRTVLSKDLADNLDVFIDSELYVATEYENADYPASPIYIEIEPHSTSGFNVTASGVAAWSPTCSHPLDRIVVVSGTGQGWHLYGEDSGEIQKRVASGRLRFKRVLT